MINLNKISKSVIDGDTTKVLELTKAALDGALFGCT